MEIPQSVTQLASCFENCEKLYGVKLHSTYIAPSGSATSGPFTNLFLNCNALGKNKHDFNNHIIIPSPYWSHYTATTAMTDMKVPGDNEEAQKEVFNTYNP